MLRNEPFSYIHPQLFAPPHFKGNKTKQKYRWSYSTNALFHQGPDFLPVSLSPLFLPTTMHDIQD